MIICNFRNTPWLEEIATLNGGWGVTAVFKGNREKDGWAWGWGTTERERKSSVRCLMQLKTKMENEKSE